MPNQSQNHPAGEFWNGNYTTLWTEGGVGEPQSPRAACQPSTSPASEMFASCEYGNATGCKAPQHLPGISHALCACAPALHASVSAGRPVVTRVMPAVAAGLWGHTTLGKPPEPLLSFRLRIFSRWNLAHDFKALRSHLAGSSARMPQPMLIPFLNSPGAGPLVSA